MPYPMTHFYIAKNVLNHSLWTNKSKSKYYLGTISPDSVQFRKEYDKKESHICFSNESWGFVTNNHEWEKCVIEFIRDNYKKIDKDFILGYGIHILADIQNNIKIWTPFRLNNIGKNFKELHKTVYEENMQIDKKLYQMCNFKPELFEALKNSVEFDFLDLISVCL